MEEAAEPVTPADRAEINNAGRVRCDTGRGALVKGAMGSMAVVVPDVDVHHTFEVAPTDDEQPVQTLSAQAARPNQSRTVRIRRRRPQNGSAA